MAKVKPKETRTRAWDSAVWFVACQSAAVLKLLAEAASTLMRGFGTWTLRPSADSSNDALIREIGGRGTTKFCVHPIATEMKEAGGLQHEPFWGSRRNYRVCSIVTDEQKILDHVYLLALVCVKP